MVLFPQNLESLSEKAIGSKVKSKLGSGENFIV